MRLKRRKPRSANCMVKAVKMDRGELSAFLKAYASGEITLPEGDYSGDTEETEDEE